MIPVSVSACELYQWQLHQEMCGHETQQAECMANSANKKMLMILILKDRTITQLKRTKFPFENKFSIYNKD